MSWTGRMRVHAVLYGRVGFECGVNPEYLLVGRMTDVLSVR